MERTVIVGDVHGCRAELEDLIRVCGWQRGGRLILAGDLVAKGPDSQGVVQLAREWGALAVLGNHDAHVLRVRGYGAAGPPPGHRRVKREHQQVVDTLSAADWAYLEALPLFLRLGADDKGREIVVLHAGAVPGVSIDAQSRENLISMRSITLAGAATKKIEGTPWAAMWRGPEHIVFGHDAVRGLQQYELATGLDTGCVYGHRLTALLLPEGRLVSVPARRSYVA